MNKTVFYNCILMFTGTFVNDGGYSTIYNSDHTYFVKITYTLSIKLDTPKDLKIIGHPNNYGKWMNVIKW